MTGTWSFSDPYVVKNFQRIAYDNIPGYMQVINRSLSIADRFLEKSDHIVEVGCARGHTLKQYVKAGYTRLSALDNCPEMLEACKLECPEVSFFKLSDEFLHATMKYVLANWTLHFIPEAKRLNYLFDIYDRLEPGGKLFLTEKVTCSPFLHDLYLDFKRGNGMTESEIADKTDSIRGVLTTWTAEKYLTTLQATGFKHVDILESHLPMVTFLCHK